MDDVSITETESRYFGDLFLCCDAEKSGKVPILKATEMFRSANLSNDVIRQITGISGIPQTAIHMSRAQFYACLKLIAAHQAGVQPLRAELVSASVQLPLPKFSWTSSPTRPIDGRTTIEQMANGCAPGSGAPAGASSLLSPSSFVHLVGVGAAPADTGNSDVPSTDSEVEHTDGRSSSGRGNERHRRTGPNGSPEAWSTASDSPTPTNSVTERPWAQNALWQCEEQRQLLGTEEESSDRHSSDEDPTTLGSLANGTAPVAPGSDAPGDLAVGDLQTVFQITGEQRDYYLKQFRTVQPNIGGLLAGHAARVFFEKSRIPVDELRHIWQLCDVTRDGALSLAEFTAAMHLVVLRRNGIPLPPTLPHGLHPRRLAPIMIEQAGGAVVERTQPLVEADLLHLDDDELDPVADAQPDECASTDASTTVDVLHDGLRSPILGMSAQQALRSGSRSNTPPQSLLLASVCSALTANGAASGSSLAADSTGGSPRASAPAVNGTTAAASGAGAGDWMSQSKEWTKFTESPTSNVSSPGPKPANFDMQRTAQAVVSDPLILHPVPVRVTPVVPGTDGATVERPDAPEADATLRPVTPPQQFASMGVHRDSLNASTAETSLRAIQRPQPKKVPSGAAGALPPPPQREPSTGTMDIGAAAEQLTGAQVAAMASSFVCAIGSQRPPQQQQIPPPPPPRPHKHARSSSLDLNKLKLNGPLPPEVPPRVSPAIVAQASLDPGHVAPSSFADFTQFPNANAPEQSSLDVVVPDAGSISASLQSSLRSSAFEVYRKPAPAAETAAGRSNSFQSPEVQPRISSSGAQAAATVSDYERRVAAINETLRQASLKQSERNVTEVVHHLREQNHLLVQLCRDLSDELASVQRKKEELRARYETVQPALAPAVSASVAAVLPAGGVSSAVHALAHPTHHSIV